jgi:hypothetical protein
MQQFAKRLIGLVLAVSFLFSLAGCDRRKDPRYSWGSPYNDTKNPVVETDYFYVYLRLEEGYAVILELTELGKQQKVLAIPDHVEGLPVTRLGWRAGAGIMSSAELMLTSENLRKLYLPHTVSEVGKWFASSYVSLETVVLLSQHYPHSSYSISFSVDKIVITQEAYDSRPSPSAVLVRSNLVYYYNYDSSPNLGVYWVDNLTIDDPFIDPENPTRNGYGFMGWYLEPECVTLWDGTNPTAPDEIVLVYAGWQENQQKQGDL